MNLFLEYSARDPVFMSYAIQLVFKILFHPCRGGIQSLLGYVIKAPLLSPRKDAERQGGEDTQYSALADPSPSQEPSAHQRPICPSLGEQRGPRAGRNPN